RAPSVTASQMNAQSEPSYTLGDRAEAALAASEEVPSFSSVFATTSPLTFAAFAYAVSALEVSALESEALFVLAERSATGVGVAIGDPMGVGDACAATAAPAIISIAVESLTVFGGTQIVAVPTREGHVTAT